MYTYTLELNIAGAENAITEPVKRYGVLIFVDADPDVVGYDFKIEQADTTGIAIFREFATKMAEHYKSLDNG